jgi:hypothetical protein
MDSNIHTILKQQSVESFKQQRTPAREIPHQGKNRTKWDKERLKATQLEFQAQREKELITIHQFLCQKQKDAINTNSAGEWARLETLTR